MCENEKCRFDTKSKFLYENAKQFSDIYCEAILEAYEKTFNGSIRGEQFTPAEIIDDLACFMYEYEENNDE